MSNPRLITNEGEKKEVKAGDGFVDNRGTTWTGPQHCRLGITQPPSSAMVKDIWYGIVTTPYCPAGVCNTCNYVSWMAHGLADMPTPVHAPTGPGAKYRYVPKKVAM